MAVQFLLQKSYSLDEFARLNDVALTTVRSEIKAGRLVARKIGRRTIIPAEDAKAWLEQLPRVQPQAIRLKRHGPQKSNPKRGLQPGQQNER